MILYESKVKMIKKVDTVLILKKPVDYSGTESFV